MKLCTDCKYCKWTDSTYWCNGSAVSPVDGRLVPMNTMCSIAREGSPRAPARCGVEAVFFVSKEVAK